MSSWKTATQPERPLLITFLCSLLFFALLAAALSFPQVLPAAAARHGDWIWLYSAGGTLAVLICIVGLWFMQSWALYLMSAVCVAELLTAATHDLPVMSITTLFQIAVIVVSMAYLQQME